jgi:hypothetical protein
MRATCHVDVAPRGLTSRAGWRNQHSGSSQDSDRCSVCRPTDELQARDEATGIQAPYGAPGAVTMNTWRRIAIAAGAILLLAGCSSCPSANANLIKPTGAADVLTLSMRDAMIAVALTAPRSATTAQEGGRR